MAGPVHLVARGANAPFVRQVQGGALALPLVILTAPLTPPAVVLGVQITAGLALAGWLSA